MEKINTFVFAYRTPNQPYILEFSFFIVCIFCCDLYTVLVAFVFILGETLSCFFLAFLPPSLIRILILSMPKRILVLFKILQVHKQT